MGSIVLSNGARLTHTDFFLVFIIPSPDWLQFLTVHQYLEELKKRVENEEIKQFTYIQQ